MARGKGIQDTDQTDKQNSQKQPTDSVKHQDTGDRIQSQGKRFSCEFPMSHIPLSLTKLWPRFWVC